MSSTRDRRKADRERKAAERRARKEAGLPDPAVLDRIIVDSFRDDMYRRRPDTGVRDVVVWTGVLVKEVMRRARLELLRRGHTQEVVDGVLTARLVPPSEPVIPEAIRLSAQLTKMGQGGTVQQPPVAPADAPPVPAQTALSGHDADVQAALDALLWDSAPKAEEDA
jgi:hypothetical protein